MTRPWDNYAIILEKSSLMILSNDGAIGDKPVRSHLIKDVKKWRIIKFWSLKFIEIPESRSIIHSVEPGIVRSKIPTWTNFIAAERPIYRLFTDGQVSLEYEFTTGLPVKWGSILMNNKKTLLSICKTYSELLQLISAQVEVIKNQSWIHPQNSFV